MAGKTQEKQTAAEANGSGDDKMAEAIAYEAQIAEQAKEIRGDETLLTPTLFMELYPLLTRPIPEAFIKYVPKLEKGKPYESTGIRSVQVQIDRMNNILTPLWWRDSVEYEQDGKLAKVTIFVGNPGEDTPLIARSSCGGVDRGSSGGNVYKGSYTNAAKLAFARIGVGHEVYVGATDFDPDTDKDMAAQAGKSESKSSGIGNELAKKMVDRAWEIPAAKRTIQLAASHVADRDVGPCGTKAAATKALATLSYSQAERLDQWISDKADEDQSGD